MAPTPLTQDEQYTWMTLWSMLDAPLILGNDLTRLDPFTLALLTNDEVIAVNQDALGKQAVPLVRKDGIETWEKDLEDGSKAIALFNRGGKSAPVRLERSTLGVQGKWLVRDLWSHKDLGELQPSWDSTVQTHGAILLRISRLAHNSALRN